MSLGGVVLALGVLVAPVRDIEVSAAHVLLGDVLDLSAVPAGLRVSAAALEIAAFRPGRDRMTFTTGEAAQRARALMPALAPWLADGPAQTVSVRRLKTPSPGAACAELTNILAAGALVTAQDLSPASCEGALEAALIYDGGAVRAARSLRPGDRIAQAPASVLPSVRPGQKLLVHTRVGPVAIRREVEAVQAGRPGQPLFVRTAEGAVFSALLPEGAQ